MNTIFIRYEALSASWVGDAVTGQEKTLKCKFIFDENWDAYPIRYMIISREGKIFDPVLIDESDEAIVRGEALTERAHIMIGAVGLAVKNGETLRYNGRPCRIRVDQGNLIWEPSTEEEATAYEKLLVEVIELEKAVAAKLDSNQGTANAGRVLVVGEDGNVTPTDWVQPDWDQNDSTAKDYVKNRTHSKIQMTNALHYPTEKINVEDLGVGTHLIFTPADEARFLRWYVFSEMRYGVTFAFAFDYSCISGNEQINVNCTPETLMDNTSYNLIDSKNYSFRTPIGTVFVILDTSILEEDRRALYPEIGIYLQVSNDSTRAERCFTLKVFKFSKLSEAYIPSTIARTVDIENLPKTNAEEIAMLVETDTLPAVQNADGKLLSMGNKIIMRH